ncbi:PGF-pre-PGF domain-containing protein [Methanosarcina sp.]|uniref:PGF-pre-PGF domain-containing protein n=1 Tax=Methanosarcina sp. TaxID=2213 RepID=UPI002ABC25E9|nr:PGF-pre-PGF domain-containing protein [Methanosarcina sp.]MDY9925890.1 PGF-pre-PGF domain-containing protein [Methanosarcina sp.]
MKFHNLKPYVKYGLVLMVIISLVGTAYADTDQLVYYNWCEDNGNTIVDNSGHGNDGINDGSTTFILPTGQIARHFNGQNRVTIPNSEQLAFTDPYITFGVFFRYNYDNITNPTNCTYLVSKGNNTCSISIDHTNSILVYEIYVDGHVISGYSESQVEPDEDYEAIVTYDGSHAQLYINGIANGKGVDYTATTLSSSYNTDSWTIGSSPDTTYGLNGEIYAFYVYDRTLGSSEILDLYVNDIHSIRDSNKPGGIALSWDDAGNIHTCYQYLSIFQQYDATCTMNINKVSHRPQAVINELNELHSAGWEIAGHGYNHVNSVQFLNNNTSAAWLDQEIFPNIVEITRYGYPSYTLAYPYSARNPTTDAILAPYFRTLRTGVPSIINNNVNETTLAYYDWDNARLLYGVEIDDQRNISLQSIEYGIDYAIRTGNVLVLYGHTITPVVTGPYQTSTSRLDSILNYTSQNGGVFYHMGDLGNSSWVRPSRFSNVTANYTVSTTNLLVGGSVTFIDYSANQTTELLDFGDGSPASSTANVIHTYTTPGTYTANLTVTNDVSSQSMTKTITVILPAAPVANFTSDFTAGFPPLNVAFTDTSTGLPTSWSWDFGDGNISISQNPTHTYSAAGNYSVKLNVTNDRGSNNIQKVNYITVLPRPPLANFYSNITSGNVPLTVQFSDTSTGSPTSWNWDFGDGHTSISPNPVHTYSSVGNYTVNLTVSNANGTNSKTAVITVLQGQEGNESKVFPVADFSMSATGGYAPLSVLFTDLSQNATSRSWDVNNDGVEDSNESSFVYEYASSGIYTVKLTAINSNGMNTKTAQIAVDEKRNGGSGGGGGGSPEPAKNVEVKELSQVFITNGKEVKFDFTKNATCVVSVGFNAKKTAGKTTTIVEQLKNKSALVSELPEGEVYKSFNVWVGNSGYATSKNIENPVICFRVVKSWIQDKKIDQSSIGLNRYSEKKWTKLPTTLLAEDDKYLYFTSSVSGYSSFAITGETTANETENEVNPAEDLITPKPETQEDKQNNTASEIEQKKRISMPGFEMIYCIIGLLGVFLYRRR